MFRLKLPPSTLKAISFFACAWGGWGIRWNIFWALSTLRKKINRTLVLPPFVYSDKYRKVNWNEWFQVKPLKQFHRVILAEPFMKLVAPEIWPKGNRLGFCWKSSYTSDEDFECKMKHGVPFAPFWDALHVDFDGYVGHELSYHNWDQWRDTYPPETYPVVAMKGAPAPFPMRIEHWGLQKYVKFSEEIVSQTDLFVKGFMGGKKFVGIHLRNGPDWAIACEIFDDTPSMKTASTFMASPQCYGQHHETNTAPFAYDVCYNSKAQVVATVKRAVKSIKAQLVYIATDQNSFEDELKAELPADVDVMFLDPDLPLNDVALLARADLFIGNCFSSFTSFARRIRVTNNLPSWYFGID